MKSSKKNRFSTKPLVKLHEPHAFHFLSQHATFWIAIVSVFAFVVGNMVGQHGFNAVYHSVIGAQDDSGSYYDGTGLPLEKVPDYKKWSQYGGDPSQHTFRQVPQDALIPLPGYIAPDKRTPEQKAFLGRYYSVENMHNYEDEPGSHVGTDITTASQTPLNNIMNGVVIKTADEPNGFGKYLIVKTANAPHPDYPSDPSRNVTLYTLYAHLSAVLVSEGNIVRKGEIIGNTGNTGFATGPHLHLQVYMETCRDGFVVKSHPFWAFTSAEAREAGLTFSEAVRTGFKRERGVACSVDPMPYILANHSPTAVASKTVLADARVLAPARRRVLTRAERIAARLSKRQSSQRLALADPLFDQRAPAPSTATVSIAPVTAAGSSSTSSDQSSSASIASRSAEPVTPSKNVASIEVRVLRETERSKTLEILLRDENDNPARPEQDIYLRTDFGKATFRPAVLSPSVDIDERGRVVVEMNHETPTVVLELKSSDMQMHLLSDPITSGAR